MYLFQKQSASQHTRAATESGIEHPVSQLAFNALCSSITAFVDNKVREYAETPVSKGKKGKPDKYRSKEQIAAFLEDMLGGDGQKQHLHSLAELYGPGGKPANAHEPRIEKA
jgi:hypothetical protein